ncbi:hypothetical protein [Streptomyces sp. NPDC091215]|uniref:hypothetical protein n=1 Tax=Streptomyces sp. NPDC091215 TaxID=3155192 RepID=UPI003430858F
MNDQSNPETPDYWALARRIAEARKSGRAVSPQRVQARLDAQAARRHSARLAEAARARQAVGEAQLPEPVERIVREALLRRRIDEAVREALASPEVAESLQQAADMGASSKPLHEMTAEEWREHTRETWASRLPYARRPMTIADWVNGRAAGDGEA